jgi:hypothetical protein
VVERPGRETGDPVAELLPDGMPELGGLHVREGPRLFGNRIGDLGDSVADADHRDRARARIDVLAALAVPDPDAFGAHGLRQLPAEVLLEPGWCGGPLAHRIDSSSSRAQAAAGRSPLAS